MIKSNLRRCPLLKVTRKVVLEDGTVETVEEFNDCYQHFCQAWDKRTKSCSYFDHSEEEEEVEEEEEDE